MGAFLGYQLNTGFNTDQYSINLLAGYVTSFAANCKVHMPWWSATDYRSASVAPSYATPTFNTSYYQNLALINFAPQSGYTTTGYIVNTSLGIFGPQNNYLTSNVNRNIYVVTNINDIYWNYYRKAFSGVIGFGPNSPVWSIFSSS